MTREKKTVMDYARAFANKGVASDNKWGREWWCMCDSFVAGWKAAQREAKRRKRK